MADATRNAMGAPVLLLCLLAGCSAGHHRQGVRCLPQPFDATPLTILPAIPRGQIRPDASRLPPFAILDETLKQQRTARLPYRGLSSRDCQCLGARSSSVGNLIAKTGAGCLGGDPSEPLGAVRRAILRDGELEARNRSAGDALELLFKLAEAEGRYDVLRRSLVEIDDALASGERMKAKGMQLGDDFEILRRRRVAALNSNIELELAIDRLNAELKHRLALGPIEEPWRIWPQVDATIVAVSQDISVAVDIALARRPELTLLRTLGDALSVETAPAIRSVLAKADAVLGMSCGGTPSKWKVLMTLLGHAEIPEEEVQALCRQFQAFRAERERAIAEEVRQAVMTVDARVRQVAVAREEVQGWERRLDELKAKAERGMSTFPEQTTVELRRLEAQSTLIQQAVAWDVARVKLAQAQGILAAECGFDGCAPAVGPPLIPVASAR